MNNGLKTVSDVVARLPGARQADRAVLLGTHHDAWTFGGRGRSGTGRQRRFSSSRERWGCASAERVGNRSAPSSLAFWDAEEFG